MSAVIIYGPQGCGKTRFASMLAAHYGKSTIVDDWSFGKPLPEDAMGLCDCDPNFPRAIPFDVAMQAMNSSDWDVIWARRQHEIEQDRLLQQQFAQAHQHRDPELQSQDRWIRRVLYHTRLLARAILCRDVK